MTRLRGPFRSLLEGQVIARASGDVLVAANGDEYIDLFTGNGAVFLGHVHREVRDAVQQQLDRLWLTGALDTPARLEAAAEIQRFFPDTYRFGGLYSAGVEVTEFAMRVAREVTGRPGVVGFEGCMHGKSTAAAYLGWSNERVALPDFRRLPYVSRASEEQILSRVGAVLAGETVAAVFIEPLQGSAGGHLASPDFFRELSRLCSEYGSLLVVDEIFSGFHRTGAAFLYQQMGLSPDVVLIGKAMANGFPAAGIVLDRKHAVEPAMLPGSTYAGNPLAASAVVATLRQLRQLDVGSKVEAIEAIIVRELGPVEAAGIALRGRGALWVLELPPERAEAVVARVVQGGVIPSPTRNYLRLLPAATIRHDQLVKACRIIREACLDSGRESP